MQEKRINPMKFIDSELMEKYLQGKASPEERHNVLMWLMLNLKSSSADEDFTEILDRVRPVKDDARKDRVKKRLFALVYADRRQRSYVSRRRRRNAVMYAAMAVMCLALAGMSAAMVSSQKEMSAIVSWAETEAAYGEVKEIVLPDGSRIWLHNDSRVTYPDSFAGGRRQVFVSGEVYAEIVRDRRHPFIVSGDSVNVVVTGTKFNFRTYPDRRNVELTLVEGSVSMEYVTPRGKEGLDVVPGETVSVNLKDGNVSRYVCNADEYVSWKDRRALYFNDMTLADIAKELEREFGVKIVIQDRALGATRHFASFVNDESAAGILKTLCAGTGIEVEEKGSEIYIHNH